MCAQRATVEGCTRTSSPATCANAYRYLYEHGALQPNRLFIILDTAAILHRIDTAAILHRNGVTDTQTASQPAEPVQPLAGEFAFRLFASGIVGTGLLVIPGLAGSVGYAVAELRSWPLGLDKLVRSARGFYATIAAVTILAIALNFISVGTIKALFWSAVINGLSAGPIVVLIMLMASRRRLRGSCNYPSRNGCLAGSPLSPC